MNSQKADVLLVDGPRSGLSADADQGNGPGGTVRFPQRRSERV